MNGMLPGLLDDPNITSTLHTLNDVHIPPLRNPTPSRNTQAPLPLELLPENVLTEQDRNVSKVDNDEGTSVRSAPLTQGTSSSTTRETKKPHLAISELVDGPSDAESGQLQLPSFVSLSVVEKSPTQQPTSLHDGFPNKRPRLELESDPSSQDRHRLLPRPIQNNDKHIPPLLPAMVTGLHEPPPSAALLPSMDLDSRPSLLRTSTSKMQVKDMLQDTQKPSGRPPEQMLNTPEVAVAELPRSAEADTPVTDADTPSTAASLVPPLQPKKDPKIRRTRRKWSEAETADLLAGVKKHGFGKWKQILNDSNYTFADRTSIDLKDRFRVFAKDYQDGHEGMNDDDAQPDSSEAGTETRPSQLANLTGLGNKPRRKRHPWTSEEDAALLQGVQKYGFQWTDIHKDSELGLSHRRATDLRDRIRNLYPDGYKHAEARPLRSEVKRAEKAGKKETPAGTLYAPPGEMEAINLSSESKSANPSGISPRNVTRRQTTSGKVPSIATLTRGSEDDVRSNALRRTKTMAVPNDHSSSEQGGITLPSLALDNANDAEEWDNTLPPFINWDQEMGM
ncbi:hypothetical protein H2198_000484 [Neophaeococcomyces mojaviensis]|uniref:Uncharacterized protein n=1 Tax=Neophaeococcomyces mojaviensis TaxID=3383035 RepID=A0ACC3AJL3_9EURO|nr:hypothetical protein H2198_000484 [Knufia sp. JES_112]